jgi:hypothetical protein
MNTARNFLWSISSYPVIASEAKQSSRRCRGSDFWIASSLRSSQ